jgi:hypothetical protein
MNINIIQHKLLYSAISQGLNHIPLQLTIIAKVIASKAFVHYGALKM